MSDEIDRYPIGVKQMTAETLRVFLRRDPFEPFVIHMTDGRQFEVQHRDFLFLPPSWDTTAIIAYPKGKGSSFDFIYLKNVTGIQSQGEIPTLPDKRRREDSE